jgi:hypothetical protein
MIAGRLLPGLPADRRWRIALVVLAAIGACLLAVVALNRWGTPSDEFAYWLAAKRLVAGGSLYDPNATPGTPYAYFYPPPLAQALAALTVVLPDGLYVAGWTALLLACLFWLGGRNALAALALVAFLPVAVELWFRNVHLALAVVLVLGLRRGGWWFAIGAAIKMTPALGIVYLASRGRWRDATLASLVGAGLLALSVAISPAAWREFIDMVAGSAGNVGASILPVPFWPRAILGVGLAVVAGRLRPRFGEPLLVAAIVVANPTLWVTALSMLVAIIPLVRNPAASDRRSGYRQTRSTP